MRWAKNVLAKRASTSSWMRIAATGTAMAAMACWGSMPRATEKAVARMVPELASILEAPPKVPTPRTMSCMEPPTNRPVATSPMTRPANRPANTGVLMEE